MNTEGDFMTRFEELLDLHGARLERWPPADAEQARARIDTDDVARRMFAHAQRLDAELARIAEPVPLSADRLGRLMHGLAERRRNSGMSLSMLFRPRAAAAMMAAACLVFSLGAWTGAIVDPAAEQVILAGVDIGGDMWSGLDQ